MNEAANGDEEEAAIAAFGLRVTRSRGLIAGVCALIGMVLGVCGYLLLRQLSLTTLDVNVPIMTGALGFLPPFAAMFWLAGKLGKWYVRMRADSWIASIAAKHHVTPSSIVEACMVWD